MLKRLGTRQRRPDNQGHRQLGSHLKSTTAIFSAPTGRLGCRRGSTRALGERRPAAGTPIEPSSRGRAAGNYRSPTSTQDCRTSLHGFPLMGRDAWRAAGRKGSLPETRAGARRRVLTRRSTRGPIGPAGLLYAGTLLSWTRMEDRSLPRCQSSCLQPDAVTCGPWLTTPREPTRTELAARARPTNRVGSMPRQELQ
jgi:hypothetical protein